MCAEFFNAGLRFQCKKCSSCCRFEPGIVSLSERDLSRFVLWAKMNRASFIKKYCRWVSVVLPSGKKEERLCLKEKQNYDCIFWDGGCKAYEARPLQCSSFPFWESILQNKERWDEERKSCPGINSGILHTQSEILMQLEKRKLEPFITKKN